MSGTIIKSARNTTHAPQDLGPCTQTVAFSHYNNISAQLPVDPTTGKMVSGDVSAQARQCLSNLKAIHREHRPCDGRYGQSDHLPQRHRRSGGGQRRLSRILPGLSADPHHPRRRRPAAGRTGADRCHHLQRRRHLPASSLPADKLARNSDKRHTIRSPPIPSPSPTTTISAPSCRSKPPRASWSPVASRSRRASACAISRRCWRASTCRLTISSRSPSI